MLMDHSLPGVTSSTWSCEGTSFTLLFRQYPCEAQPKAFRSIFSASSSSNPNALTRCRELCHRWASSPTSSVSASSAHKGLDLNHHIYKLVFKKIADNITLYVCLGLLIRRQLTCRCRPTKNRFVQADLPYVHRGVVGLYSIYKCCTSASPMCMSAEPETILHGCTR